MGEKERDRQIDIRTYRDRQIDRQAGRRDRTGETYISQRDTAAESDDSLQLNVYILEASWFTQHNRNRFT